jgi:hypothetical protein
MKAILPAAWIWLGVLMMGHAPGVMAAAVQEKPATSARRKKPAAKSRAVKRKQKKAAGEEASPVASKSKPASEVAKTRLPSAGPELAQGHGSAAKPAGTVPMPKHDAILPQMFGEKNSGFQLNGRLLSNEMQLQLRNEERREVEGAALDFEFKQ